jgi:hypothetical protein
MEVGPESVVTASESRERGRGISDRSGRSGSAAAAAAATAAAAPALGMETWTVSGEVS